MLDAFDICSFETSNSLQTTYSSICVIPILVIGPSRTSPKKWHCVNKGHTSFWNTLNTFKIWPWLGNIIKNHLQEFNFIPYNVYKLWSFQCATLQKLQYTIAPSCLVKLSSKFWPWLEKLSTKIFLQILVLYHILPKSYVISSEQLLGKLQ